MTERTRRPRLTRLQSEALNALRGGAVLYRKQDGGLYDRRTLSALVRAGLAEWRRDDRFIGGAMFYITFPPSAGAAGETAAG